MKNLFLIAFLVSAIANATPPAPSPVNPPPPEIIKEKPAKKVSSSSDVLNKVEKITKGCDTNKKKCVYKLKELRATIKDPKTLKRIDEILKTLK